MQRENNLYKQLGFLVVIALALIIITPVLIPSNSFINDECQEFSCPGVDVKENSLYFQSFLKSIKAKNGVLVLGSSETNAFTYSNFHYLLNTKYDLSSKYSVLAGAGRTAHIYFPVILNNKDLFKGLKVLYFINPTYWRQGLNQFSFEYYERYNNEILVNSVKSDLQDLDLFKKYAEPFLGQEVASKYPPTFIHSYLFQLRDYYKNFNSLIYQDESKVKSCLGSINFTPRDSSVIQSLMSELIPQENISVEFKKNDPKTFPQVDTSSFQLGALKGFHRICEEVGIEITYILGPYNKIYCQNNNPEYCTDHDRVVNEIENFLKSVDARYIDCTFLSETEGSFIDIQHHSKLGAWLIADKVAEYYE